MLKTEQVPMEVKRAMRAAWARRNNSDAPEKTMADLLIAAINAWPGMEIEVVFMEDQVVLPLPMENSNE